ncbi:phospholipase [Chitinophaga sp. SYP-B3965]|uniref:extracellular catalytic domain type 1 short-chain-length polyhydroxyalkanoate depolymerase n=1 Tax=Chitinophaga sp. SYP-B3965 TaxID=2663120 RepID=UPI00129972FC|nr:PHB depolymerase family esterase [Chitinophaga sp. SYP-B3965]MRG45808.1 phospholipase [Chitinophaga sp. SYP-B3965]
MKNIFMQLPFLLSLLLLTNCDRQNDPDTGRQYRFSGTITVDGRTRHFLLNLPPDYYEEGESFPLVIGLHGAGGSGSQFELDYRFIQKANSARFIAVYPDGVRSDGILGLRFWNAGYCCNYASDNNINDVKFISELIDKLVAEHKIDRKKVYVAGMSNGGMMAYRLACEIPEKIAAIATVSCSMVQTQSCTPSRAVPILHLHSELDAKIPYKGGIGLAGYYYPPVDSVLNIWSAKNNCTTGPQVITDNEKYKLTEWPACGNGAVMQCYLTKDGGHAWPGGSKSRDQADTPSTAINANDVIWDFFERFSL